MLEAKGTFFSNIFFGKNPFYDWYTPYRVKLNTATKVLTILKRNYYLIGLDSVTIPVKNIRNVTYNAHLFGADLQFKVFGTKTQVAYCLKKSEAKKIRDYLILQMSGGKGIHVE